MNQVLITGGCGFVGRRFARRFLNDGWHVTVVDDLSAGLKPHEWDFPAESWKHLDTHFFDCRHLAARQWLPDDFDLIVHCAAVVGGRLKIDGDPLAVATDLAIDSDFFRWVVKAERKPQVIYFSSSAVYPIELQTRRTHCALAESMMDFANTKLGMPDQTYGLSKLAGEYLAQTAVKQYGANILIYRPFSGYGEDQSFDYPFPSIIRRVVNRENPITIWGSGEQIRDFIYIEDIIDAVFMTEDVLKPGDVLNLGSGQPTSFQALGISAALALYGAPKGLEPIVHMERDTSKPEGVFYRVADTYKLSQFYTPKTSLGEGIRKVADHMRLTLPAA